MAALAAFVLGAAPGPAAAEQRRNTVNVVGDSAWQPFYGPELPRGGPMMQLVRTAFQRQGYAVAIDYRPWSRALAAVRAERQDVAVGAFYTEARAENFNYSQPYFAVEMAFIAHRDFPRDSYETLQDLAGYSIGIVQDNAYAAYFDEAEFLDKIEMTSREAQIRRFFSGSLELLVDPSPIFAAEARALGFEPEKAKVLAPPLTTHETHLIASRHHPNGVELLADFDRAVTAMRDDGTYAEIMAPLMDATRSDS